MLPPHFHMPLSAFETDLILPQGLREIVPSRWAAQPKPGLQTGALWAKVATLGGDPREDEDRHGLCQKNGCPTSSVPSSFTNTWEEILPHNKGLPFPQPHPNPLLPTSPQTDVSTLQRCTPLLPLLPCPSPGRHCARTYIRCTRTRGHTKTHAWVRMRTHGCIHGQYEGMHGLQWCPHAPGVPTLSRVCTRGCTYTHTHSPMMWDSSAPSALG